MSAARKQFETQRDRDQEDGIIRLLDQKWKTTSRKLNPHWVVDFAVFRGEEVAAFVEVRCRSFEWGQFETVFCSVSKLTAAKRWFEWFDLPTLFVVMDRRGELRFCDLSKLDKLPIVIDGRNSKNMRDEWDQDLMVRIPNEKFQSL